MQKHMESDAARAFPLPPRGSLLSSAAHSCGYRKHSLRRPGGKRKLVSPSIHLNSGTFSPVFQPILRWATGNSCPRMNVSSLKFVDDGRWRCGWGERNVSSMCRCMHGWLIIQQVRSVIYILIRSDLTPHSSTSPLPTSHVCLDNCCSQDSHWCNDTHMNRNQIGILIFYSCHMLGRLVFLRNRK